MSPTDDFEDLTSGPDSWASKLREVFWPSPAAGPSDDSAQPGMVPADQRKEVMRSLDPQETKFSFGALLLATIAGIAIPAYIIATNKVTKEGKDTIAVAPDAKLLGGVILILCVLGFVAVWKQKRTFVAFVLFLIGFAFTLFIGLIGFVFILLGGWLMLRAWRINKYGTTNSKLIRQEVAARPRGKAAKAAPRSTAKASSQPGARKPPTQSKRYTPKAPPRKKIPKQPTQ